jgi:hypothetical protein
VALVRQPAHGKSVAAIHHPLPVNAAVESGREGFDPGVAVEKLTAVQHSTKQQRCIDGRQFTAEEPLPAIDVYEVVEEAVLVGTFLQQEGQGFLYSLLAIQGAEVIVFCGNA